METMTKVQAQAAPAPANTQRMTLTPAVDVFENAENFLLVSDFPGVDPAGVEVRFEGNRLTLKGQVTGQTVQWAREFSLPGGIDADKITADLKNGVLSVTLPKLESLKPRQITVRAQ